MNSALRVPAHWFVNDSAAFSMALRSLTPSEASSPRAFCDSTVEATSAAGTESMARPAPIIIVPFWIRSRLRVIRSLAAATDASSDCIDDWTRIAFRENASFIETTTPRPQIVHFLRSISLRSCSSCVSSISTKRRRTRAGMAITSP